MEVFAIGHKAEAFICDQDLYPLLIDYLKKICLEGIKEYKIKKVYASPRYGWDTAMCLAAAELGVEIALLKVKDKPLTKWAKYQSKYIKKLEEHSREIYSGPDSYKWELRDQIVLFASQFTKTIITYGDIKNDKETSNVLKTIKYLDFDVISIPDLNFENEFSKYMFLYYAQAAYNQYLDKKAKGELKVKKLEI